MIKVRGSLRKKQFFFYESVQDRAVHYRIMHQAANDEEYNKIATKLQSKGVLFVVHDRIHFRYIFKAIVASA